jgi:hypothetical protein
MTDLEHHLRESARQESATYEPSTDLPERIRRRVRARRRARAMASGAVVGAAAVVVAVLALQLPGDDEQGVVVANDPSSTTAPSTTTSTSTTATTVPLPPALDVSTPLTAKGVGPIEAGMTVAEAEAASGLAFVDNELTVEFPYCAPLRLVSQPDLAVWVLPTGDRTDVSPQDFVIVQIYISGLDPSGASDRRTVGGVGLGSSEAEVRDAHAGAVEGRPTEHGADGLYVHPADAPGFGIRYTLDERSLVTSIHVGDAEWLPWSQSCL